MLNETSPHIVQEEGSSGNCFIHCKNGCNTYSRFGISNSMMQWNEAAKAGWTWDQEGKPYQSYYCKKCSDEQ